MSVSVSVSGSTLLTFPSIQRPDSSNPPPRPASALPSSSASSSSTIHDTDTHSSSQPNTVKFNYSRASPSTRYPHLKLSEFYPSTSTHTHSPLNDDVFSPKSPPSQPPQQEPHKPHEEPLRQRTKTKVKKMNKLALKRDKNWRERVKYLTDTILALKSDEFVASVLEERRVQMTPTDFCFVVKWVGQRCWQRALELYECLNLRHWYAPNARMVATILGVLGKANQEALAVEIFTRAESTVGDTVQVYNAMMGVYARNGRFNNVKELLDLMRERGCVPDLVSFNTLINARLRSAPMEPNLAIQLLDEVRSSGISPDIITYNTLISACSRESNLDEAIAVFNDMESHRCQPDLWTYNSMISVYGRCGHSKKAERLFEQLESKGFFPDAVTYNSLLYAFSKEGNLEKVRDICEEMVKKGFGKDEMTYNTIIHMYGKQGRHDQALQLYRDMKSSGRNPDAVTYTVLIDSLGKANKVVEAANVMSEMMDVGVKPSLHTYSALICAYAKAGKRVEAEETFSCMCRSGIKADRLAYSVMLDFFLRFNEMSKAMMLYQEMISEGVMPDNGLYEVMLLALVRENMWDVVDRIIRDMEELSGMNPQVISSVLVKGGCYDHAAKMLKVAISSGYELDHENFLSIMSSYSSSARYSEACELLEFLREHAPDDIQIITEALIIILCKAKKLDAALEEYRSKGGLGSFRSCTTYESLIQECLQNELFDIASQIFSDMRFNGVEPSECLYKGMVSAYCRMGLPETAQHLLYHAEKKGVILDNVSVYINIIETYAKLKIWQKAESLVGSLRQRCSNVDRKVWNALIHAYACSGCYERARAIFNTMMRDGPSPTVDSINGLLQALIVDGRLNELYVVIQELQDMGFRISKSSILLTLEAFAQAGNLFEVQKIYNGMKAAGYFPTMHLYRIMLRLLCKCKRVRDAEAMLCEMEEAGFKPDLQICNSMLKLYLSFEDFRNMGIIYQKIQDTGLNPDEETYNTLIIMYCRDCRPEEAFSLLNQMRSLGLEPKRDTYRSLIAAFSKLHLYEQAEELFEELRSNGYKLDRAFYHLMMKMYRTSGDHLKAENLLAMMKEESGIEPTVATMHLLMVSYGKSGQPEEAEKVLKNLRTTGVVMDSLPYSSVMGAYLRKGDFKAGIEKLSEMKEAGIEPDHRIWTCFIRAASLSEAANEAIVLLNALEGVGFDLPIRLLREKSESLVSEVDQCLERLEPLEDNAAFNFVNALVDLLWAFELRATASWVFQLAIKRSIYRHNIFRVADKDWGADFRKLSAGSALVGLTLWLDHMQDASLQGYPESPKSVVLITGTAEYNMVSLDSTLKACLWEMGSPFLPCKTKHGVLVAKAHSLRMWLKDSPFCLDLELKDSPNLPELNSMRLIEGCFIRRGLVPAFKEITEKLKIVSPKKFSRLALLPDDKRSKTIEAYTEGRKERLEKRKNIVDPRRLKKIRMIKKLKMRKYIQEASIPNAIGKQRTFKPIGTKQAT